MSDSDDRRAKQGAAAAENEDAGLVSINLRKELRPEELEQFLANAKAAGRTPEEHFKAITLGTRAGHAA